jgi:hypothetical protein
MPSRFSMIPAGFCGRYYPRRMAATDPAVAAVARRLSSKTVPILDGDNDGFPAAPLNRSL